jgi:para-aminobenzoate synthetase/4-amino-4-deoxychorismate lyase
MPEFIDALKKIEKYKQNYYLVGYIRYEAKDIFFGKNIDSKLPLLYFEIKNIFELKLLSTITFDRYLRNIKKIKYEIEAGNTYEVNYTFDFNVKFDGSEFELYQYLLQKQSTPYAAFIKNKFDTLLSFSPELFFTIKNNHIITKPMKGTIIHGKNEYRDVKNINFLKNDIKNRAENIMIVDLLRNDLSKIAKPGSIKVTGLFDIETHPTLHQSGSVTGAPKISTMNIISAIKKGNRGIYRLHNS